MTQPPKGTATTTATAPSSSDALARVLSRLPEHLIARDAEAGGTLHALLGAAAGELALLEQDLQNLYDGWFVETCAEWLLPYLADLVGLDELPPDLGPGTSRRALVANTIAYRRRKGTVTVLEQVTADVTGWPARAAEFYQHLVVSTHLDHLQLDRPAVASVRDTAAMRQVALTHAASTTLTPGVAPVAHTAEVRGIGSGRGRYGLPAVGVFLHPLRVDDVGPRGWSRAARSPDGTYTVDPLGRAVPLFTQPSDGPDLPVPLSPHALLAQMQAARRQQAQGHAVDPPLPLGVWVSETALDPAAGTALGPDPQRPELVPSALRVAGLEDLDRGEHAEPTQVLVDPTTGRLTVYSGGRPDVAADRGVAVRYAGGSSADLGAGTYDRAVLHEQVIESDRYDGPAETVAQVAVLAATSSPTTAVVASTAAAADLLATAPPGSQVLSVGDNARYDEDIHLRVPAGARLVLVAAAWPDGGGAGVPGFYLPDGLRAHLRGTLTITGGPGSSVVLDGVLLDGDLTIASGQLGSLTVSQSTVAGRITMLDEATPSNGDLRVRVVRSLMGGIELGAVVPGLSVTDSVVDAALDPRAASGAAAVSGTTVHAAFEGVTVRGEVTVRSIDASSCVFDGPLTIAHRQTGSLRYCYTRPGSPTPRRFHCVPAEVWGAEPVSLPVYASTRPGAPDYLALAAACSPKIRTGGEYDAEMGVHHHLRRPLRVAAAARQLASYLPVGREIGIFGS